MFRCFYVRWTQLWRREFDNGKLGAKNHSKGQKEWTCNFHNNNNRTGQTWPAVHVVIWGVPSLSALYCNTGNSYASPYEYNGWRFLLAPLVPTRRTIYTHITRKNSRYLEDSLYLFLWLYVFLCKWIKHFTSQPSSRLLDLIRSIEDWLWVEH